MEYPDHFSAMHDQSHYMNSSTNSPLQQHLQVHLELSPFGTNYFVNYIHLIKGLKDIDFVDNANTEEVNEVKELSG